MGWDSRKTEKKEEKKKSECRKSEEKIGPEGNFIFATRIPVLWGLFPLSKLITTCVSWSNTIHKAGLALLKATTRALASRVWYCSSLGGGLRLRLEGGQGGGGLQTHPAVGPVGQDPCNCLHIRMEGVCEH